MAKNSRRAFLKTTAGNLVMALSLSGCLQETGDQPGGNKSNQTDDGVNETQVTDGTVPSNTVLSQIIGDLRGMKSALENGELYRMLEVFGEFSDKLAIQRSRYSELERLAQAVRDEASSESDAEDAAVEYITSSLGNTISAGSVGVLLLGYLGGRLTEEELSNGLSDVIDNYESIQETTNKLMDAKRGLDLPPILGLYGKDSIEVPKGTTQSRQLTVENLGNQEITDIQITSNTDFNSSLKPSTFEVLMSGQAESVDLEVTANEVPEDTFGSDVVVEASSVDADASMELDVVVAGKKEYLEAAVSQTGQLQGRMETEELNNTMSGIRSDLEDLLEEMESSDEPSAKSINDGMEQSLRELENLANSIRQREGLSKKNAAWLAYDTNQVTVTVERGIEAEL